MQTSNEGQPERLKRFRRQRNKISGISLKERDEEILRLVFDFRFMRSDLLFHLLNENGDTSHQNLLRRLQRLYHHGFLDRPPQHQVYSYRGSKKMVYAIGNLGYDLLFWGTDRERGKWSWTTKNREAKYPHIEHTLMVATFYTVLTLALRKLADIEFTDWEMQRSKLTDRFEVEERGRRVRRAICPDAFFGLADPDGAILYCLEADQSTHYSKPSLDKFRKYWQWKFHARRAKIKFGSDSLLILTITPSVERRDNLRDLAREADDKKKGSPYFWFASQTDYSLEEPESILKPIWYTPVNDTPHRLLE